MSNDLVQFNFEDRGVRTIMRDGEPWFVAKDVCDILEIVNARDAVSTLDEDERITLDNPDGNPRAGNPLTFNVISESGLYALVFKSRKENAKKFRRWVTSEVLPQIRKTGRYKQKESTLLLTEIAAREFKAYHSVAQLVGLEGNAALISADNTIRRERGISLLKTMQIELKNEEQEQVFTPTELGRMMGMEGKKGAREVNRALSLCGFQERVGDRWVLTEKGKGFAVVIDTGKKHNFGAMVQQIKWKKDILYHLQSLRELIKYR